MGASNCPETPRQKMIQMMYLVYTAMLALNVSAAVVSSFVTVGDAMNMSNENIQAKLDDTYTRFEELLQNNREKTQEHYDKAKQVKALTLNLTQYIDSIECDFLCEVQTSATVTKYADDGSKEYERDIQLVDASGNHLLDSARSALKLGGLSIIKKKDDNHAGTAYFYKEEGGGRSEEIRGKIREYKTNLKKILGEDSNSLQIALDVDAKGYNEEAHDLEDWEKHNFAEQIQIAYFVTLSRLKAEAMNAEFDAVNILYKKVGKGDFKFDQIAIIGRPKSTYIIQGGVYETDINVAAYDSKAQFEATINGQKIVSNDSGSVHYRTPAGATGQKTVQGTVYVKTDEGVKEYPFKDSYFVAEPVAIVSLTNMNVVYAGIDNPVSISVPGIDTRNVTPSVQESGASITKDPNGKAGDYIIKTTQTAGKIHVVTHAKADGKTNQQMGVQEFRIKKVPDPVIVLGKYKNGQTIPMSELRAMNGFRASMGDDFSFKMTAPRVTAFDFNLSRSGKEDISGKGNSSWNPEMKSMLEKAKPGQKIYLDNIKIVMADGTTRTTSATFRIGK